MLYVGKKSILNTSILVNACWWTYELNSMQHKRMVKKSDHMIRCWFSKTYTPRTIVYKNREMAETNNLPTGILAPQDSVHSFWVWKLLALPPHWEYCISLQVPSWGSWYHRRTWVGDKGQRPTLRGREQISFISEWREDRVIINKT